MPAEILAVQELVQVIYDRTLSPDVRQDVGKALPNATWIDEQ